MKNDSGALLNRWFKDIRMHFKGMLVRLFSQESPDSFHPGITMRRNKGARVPTAINSLHF